LRDAVDALLAADAAASDSRERGAAPGAMPRLASLTARFSAAAARSARRRAASSGDTFSDGELAPDAGAMQLPMVAPNPPALQDDPRLD
jgi:hypothetical protein